MSLRGGAEYFSSVVGRFFIAAVLSLLIVIVIETAPATADIAYVYDELGRLIGVIDPASDTAVYSYDAVGNLLGIARYSSSTVSIIDFQPKSGPIGTSVTIDGTGFSTTPASNTVTVNGVAASVTSATATRLTVSVPAGATSGPIGVTVAGTSTTSSTSFTVTATGDAPTITSFSPTIGSPTTPITITGTGFEPVPINNRVVFYGAPPAQAVVSSATITSLGASVPTTARSGPLTVSTPGGTAVSSADFFVPTGGFTAAQVVFTGRIVVGGASVDVPVAANKIALLIFAGSGGQRLDLGTTLLSGAPPANVTVYRPDGAALPTTASNPAGNARYLPPLPMAGLYVIQVSGGLFGYSVRRAPRKMLHSE